MSKLSVISVKDLWKKFRRYRERRLTLKELVLSGGRGESQDLWVLKGINLEVEEGETLGIIGVNGSGKTTLLSLLAGILKPTRGSILIRGKVAPFLELGAGFHPDLTGRENVYLYGAILGLKRKEISQKFNEIVNFSELEAEIESTLKTYSSGMYMRLGFSVAVQTDPDILLVDEVLAVGDEHFQRKCYQKIEELQRTKKTILFVSHDLNIVKRLTTRVIWLHDGLIAAEGPPETVIKDYLKFVEKENSPA